MAIKKYIISFEKDFEQYHKKVETTPKIDQNKALGNLEKLTINQLIYYLFYKKGVEQTFKDLALEEYKRKLRTLARDSSNIKISGRYKRQHPQDELNDLLDLQDL